MFEFIRRLGLGIIFVMSSWALVFDFLEFLDFLCFMGLGSFYGFDFGAYA